MSRLDQSARAHFELSARSVTAQYGRDRPPERTNAAPTLARSRNASYSRTLANSHSRSH